MATAPKAVNFPGSKFYDTLHIWFNVGTTLVIHQKSQGLALKRPGPQKLVLLYSYSKSNLGANISDLVKYLDKEWKPDGSSSGKLIRSHSLYTYRKVLDCSEPGFQKFLPLYNQVVVLSNTKESMLPCKDMRVNLLVMCLMVNVTG